MPAPAAPPPRLHGLSAAEWTRLGQQSLRDHLAAQAVIAHRKHGPLTRDNLDRFLVDPDCLRHPTRLAFEFGEMAPHQFAQPGLDHRRPQHDGRILFLRPVLRSHPRLVVLAATYFVPVINYGDVIDDEHCLLYGATVLGLLEFEFYNEICRLADFAGSESRYLPGG